MGLFGGKKEEAPQGPKVERPVLRDGDGWAVCARHGDEMFEKGEFAFAVECWTEAVDRWDGTDGDFQRMYSLIPSRVTAVCVRETEAGSVCPVNLLSRVEAEMDIKHPEKSAEWSLTGRTAELIASKISSCTSAERAIMLCMDACFCQMGYIACVADIREVPIRCADAIACANLADEAVRTLANPRDRKGMNLRSGHRSALLFKEFFGDLRSAAETAISGRTQEEICKAVSYRTEHRTERTEALAHALEEKTLYANATALTRKQHARACYGAIADFVDGYFAEDP